MNAEKCEFLAANQQIEIIPRISEKVVHLISGDVGPFEAGIPTKIPVWMALMLKRKHHCHIVPPGWLAIEELKKILISESDNLGLSHLPDMFFELSHMLVKEASDNIFEVDQVKSLIQDIYDKREAKLRTSAITFLSQNETCHAQLDGVQPIEVASSRATLEACKQMAILIRNKHQSTPI
ncbi:unnamed protein product [Caenorhabditis angaria]|uniref:DNA replication complex GINS protein PSF2 n=1 Tax=Caenorhabditis angaria TaxID=860376 RepID=A0A9P1I521_9PELO|nr:unnamed protein product [Caenorhabditis angaria]